MIIAYATLLENDVHKNEVKKRILSCFTDKVFILNKFVNYYDDNDRYFKIWNDDNFKDANKHFNVLINN